MKDVDYDYVNDLLDSDFVEEVEVFGNGDSVSFKNNSNIGKKALNDYQTRTNIVCIIVGIAFWLFIIFCLPKIIDSANEEHCVKFHEEYGYVLDDCEKWSDKLKGFK